MKECVITVDVYAHWIDKAPVYRVFVDDDLLTERDFIWPGREIFVCENVIVMLEPGPHELKVEQVSGNGTITTKNIHVNGVASSNQFTITE